MQVPILNGVFSDTTSNFRTAYPRNLVPVPKSTGLSDLYLRCAEGVTLFSTGVGLDRGAINWNDVLYRVQETKLIKVDSLGVVTEIGDVGSDGRNVSMAYSFSYLCVVSNNSAYLYDGKDLKKITDDNLGFVKSVVFVDGYFLFCDNTNLIVNELVDPFSINPLKYGSAEVEPDPIQCVLKIKNELIAVGRYTCESYTNVGTEFFPFQRIPGALISKGAVGTNAAVNFQDTVAFVGGGVNEGISVWLGLNGQASKVSTRDIDYIISQYPEDVLKDLVLDCKIDQTHATLFIHLPDRTLCFDAKSSEKSQESVWYTLDSGTTTPISYCIRNFVRAYGKSIGGAVDGKLGYFDDTHAKHFGQPVGWEFYTKVLYAEGRDVIVHEVELLTLSGNNEVGNVATVWTSFTNDGVVWSMEKPKTGFKVGVKNTRLAWLKQGRLKNWRIQRFRGFSDNFMSFLGLNIRLEVTEKW
jgi:hypothetical protein